jgi:hypothetical protein
MADVEYFDETLARIKTHGGEIVQKAHLVGADIRLGTFRDLASNVAGRGHCGCLTPDCWP